MAGSTDACGTCRHFALLWDGGPVWDGRLTGCCARGFKEWWRTERVLDEAYKNQRAGAQPACDEYEEWR